MAVPKKKIARSRGRVRHTAFVKKTQKKLQDKVQLVECKKCGEKRMSHMACPSCGTYKGKDVTTKKKAAVTKVQA